MKAHYYQNPQIKRNLIVNDITQLNPVTVKKVFIPSNVEDLSQLIMTSKDNFSLGGGRFSMGGQTAVENTTYIDLRQLNKIIHLNTNDKLITVQAGVKWHQIQSAVDPHNLSVKIMQTYANFTVGGSLSVNCHGRYVGLGPVILSVKEIVLATKQGLVKASAIENTDLFFGSIGCYSALGIIVEVTLELSENCAIQRNSEFIKTEDYHHYFQKKIKGNKNAVFHNGQMLAPLFDQINAVTWEKTEKKVYRPRLNPIKNKYPAHQLMLWMLSETKTGQSLRRNGLEKIFFMPRKRTWKNNEAGYNVMELEPKTRKDATYLLQEYFIPVHQFNDFVPKMQEIIKNHKINVVNISIRHALPDSGSYLAWAKEEVYAFVIYYKQGTSKEDLEKVSIWTQELMNVAIDQGGSYYLPYQPHATKDMFLKAYPRATELFKLKEKCDPDYQFRNSLWDKYYRL